MVLIAPCAAARIGRIADRKNAVALIQIHDLRAEEIAFRAGLEIRLALLFDPFVEQLERVPAFIIELVEPHEMVDAGDLAADLVKIEPHFLRDIADLAGAVAEADHLDLRVFAL